MLQLAISSTGTLGIISSCLHFSGDTDALALFSFLRDDQTLSIKRVSNPLIMPRSTVFSAHLSFVLLQYIIRLSENIFDIHHGLHQSP